LAGTHALIKDAIEETESARQDFSNWFDISRFDTSFAGDILTLLKPKSVAAPMRKNTSAARRSTELGRSSFK